MVVKPKSGASEGAFDAALGFRPHSGWAALVAVCGPLNSPNILERRRIELADPVIPGSVQPYHAAEQMESKAAERFLHDRLDSSERMAQDALKATVDKLREQGYRVKACGLLRSAARPLPALASVLASHALIHTAEGEMFRDVLTRASAQHGFPVLGVKERELLDRCTTDLGITAREVEGRLAELGRALGPPWRQDEKFATLVAWLALAASTVKGASMSEPSPAA